LFGWVVRDGVVVYALPRCRACVPTARVVERAA